MEDKQPLLIRQAEAHLYPLLFATISGAHLYGFASPDSDFDLRGVHILPAREVLGLQKRQETVISEKVVEGAEIDIVTHDAEKFFRLMLKRNGYVLEQLYSPLVVKTSPEHEELKELGKGCITKHHVYHYLGFAKTEWELFLKGTPKVKPLLYVFRVLLTGIHLMNTGQVEANLETLSKLYNQGFLEELIHVKRYGQEHGELKEADSSFLQSRFVELEEKLRATSETSGLPDKSTAEAGLSDLLIRLRLSTV